MKTVYWTIPGALANPELDIVYFEPEPAFKYLLETKKDAEYLKCPSISGYLKNTFIVRSPMDVNIWLDKNGEFRTNSCSQKFYDEHFWCRRLNSGAYMCQLLPSFLFFTDNSAEVVAESLPVVLHETPNALFVPGSFDIAKWIRPFNYAFELADPAKPINIKRGDPLYMVKFICSNGDFVRLERKLMTEHIKSVQDACLNVKKIETKINLKTLYSMAAGYLKIARLKIFKKK